MNGHTSLFKLFEVISVYFGYYYCYFKFSHSLQIKILDTFKPFLVSFILVWSLHLAVSWSLGGLVSFHSPKILLIGWSRMCVWMCLRTKQQEYTAD